MLNLSIVVVNYKTPDLVLDCLNSIFKSESKLKYEIIVIDNGSADDSSNIIKKSITAFERTPGFQPGGESNADMSFSFGSETPHSQCGENVIKTINQSIVVIIKNNDNRGFAKAVNQGINIAKGKYILLLNSDTIIKKDALAKLVEFADKNTSIGVVGARLIDSDGKIQPSCYKLPSLGRVVAEKWFGDKRLLNKYYPHGNIAVEVEAVVGGAFLITPRAIKEVGLFDERYFMYFEDLDYCRRVRSHSLKVYYLPIAEIIHLHGASGKSLANDSNQWKRLIPSAKIYYGTFKYFLVFVIMRLDQIWGNILRNIGLR